MKCWIVSVFMGFALFGVCKDANAISISVDLNPGMAGIQSAASVTLGDMVTADIVVSGIVDDPLNFLDGLNAFVFGLDYNTAILSATGVESGGFMGPLFPFGTALSLVPDELPTDVEYGEITLGPVAFFGTGVLATISFNATGVGSSLLTVLNVPNSGPMLSAPFGSEIVVDVLNAASITVTGNGGPDPIPEPGTLLLFGTGLGGLLVGRRLMRRHTVL